MQNQWYHYNNNVADDPWIRQTVLEASESSTWTKMGMGAVAGISLSKMFGKLSDFGYLLKLFIKLGTSLPAGMAYGAVGAAGSLGYTPAIDKRYLKDVLKNVLEEFLKMSMSIDKTILVSFMVIIALATFIGTNVSALLASGI